MKERIALIFATLFLLSTTLLAQEQLGIRTDNYAGINSTLLNPAGHLTSPFQWDINLGEVSLFMDNNYAYFRNQSVPRILRNRENLEFVNAPQIDSDRTPGENEIILDYFTNNRNRFAHFNTSILGPGFYVRLGSQHTIGAYVRGRAELSGRGISTNFSYYDYYNRPFSQDFPVDDFQATFMAWRETALNYMYQTSTAQGLLGIGVTAKFVQPYEAAFFKVNASTEMAKLPGNSIQANGLDLEYGYTTSNLETDNLQASPNGSGLAFDLGFVYTIGDEDKYDWKIGASILDLGKATINQNAAFHQVAVDSSVVINSESYNTFEELSDLERLARTFSQETLGDSTASLQGDRFGVWLPTALSLQVDHAFADNIFINATLVQSIPFSARAVRRSDILAVSPRFEHRWFGATLPVVLHNWQNLRLGLSLKLGFLYLGTDNLGSLLGQSELRGTDFYLALKVNPFALNTSKRTRRDGRPIRGKKGNVKCYDF